MPLANPHWQACWKSRCLWHIRYVALACTTTRHTSLAGCRTCGRSRPSRSCRPRRCVRRDVRSCRTKVATCCPRVGSNRRLAAWYHRSHSPPAWPRRSPSRTNRRLEPWVVPPPRHSPSGLAPRRRRRGKRHRGCRRWSIPDSSSQYHPNGSTSNKRRSW